MNENKRIIEIEGQQIVVPIIKKTDITVGLRRKTRNLKEDRAAEEIIWLLFEKLLTDEELEVFDNLSDEAFAEAVKDVFEYDPKALNFS